MTDAWQRLLDECRATIPSVTWTYSYGQVHALIPGARLHVRFSDGQIVSAVNTPYAGRGGVHQKPTLMESLRHLADQLSADADDGLSGGGEVSHWVRVGRALSALLDASPAQGPISPWIVRVICDGCGYVSTEIVRREVNRDSAALARVDRMHDSSWCRARVWRRGAPYGERCIWESAPSDVTAVVMREADTWMRAQGWPLSDAPPVVEIVQAEGWTLGEGS